LREITVGYKPWHLNLSLGAWAADGLLAVFFFLVGLELKREFVAGNLRQVSRAIGGVTAVVWVPVSIAGAGRTAEREGFCRAHVGTRLACLRGTEESASGARKMLRQHCLAGLSCIPSAVARR
jgi:hypothetical protein